MLGAIIGDILGSAYEGGAAPARTTPLLPAGSTFTDDTVCTVAVAAAMLDGLDVAQTLQAWGRRYPSAGYGGAFRKWLFTDKPAPYNSFGNGALMRVAPAVVLAPSLEVALAQAQAVTAVTHNHPVALQAVDTYARALWVGLKGSKRTHVLRAFQAAKVPLHSVERAHQAARFGLRADEAMEDVHACLARADDFEGLMRECLYHGGDTDTIAAIAGPLGEVLWGVDEPLVDRILPLLPQEMKQVMGRFYLQLSALHPEHWSE